MKIVKKIKRPLNRVKTIVNRVSGPFISKTRRKPKHNKPWRKDYEEEI
ncbi:MAG: hypothetical protein N3A54_00700 [Patescibacteria group bacterium]|nr:hypothetical protein [Patescibacteria group bacterium]